jgi:hypothetical protein
MDAVSALEERVDASRKAQNECQWHTECAAGEWGEWQGRKGAGIGRGCDRLLAALHSLLTLHSLMRVGGAGDRSHDREKRAE